MANEILIKHGTAIVWANTTDYSSTVSGLVRTHQIDLTSVASAAARQGAKVDLEYLATAKFPNRWLVLGAFEFDVVPADGNSVAVYWAGSPSATAGNANPGGTTGADAAYTGTAGSTLFESLKQLEFIGSLVATNDAATVVQYQTLGILSGIPRYGMPVVQNLSAQAFEGDAVEMYVALIPLVDEVQ